MRITISIPKPCHEDWQAMTPDASWTAGKGRHCAQCDHVVVDLSRATDAELVALFSSDVKPKCARFDPAQLDRVLGTLEAPRQAGALPVAAFTTLAAVASGCGPISPGRTLGVMDTQVEQRDPAVPPTSTPEDLGLLEPATVDTPLAEIPYVLGDISAASVPANRTETIRCVTLDENRSVGEVVVDPAVERMEQGKVVVQANGEIMRSAQGAPQIAWEPEMVEVCGTVVDDRSGEPIPYAQLWTTGVEPYAATDAAGMFHFRVPLPPEGDAVTIEVRSPGFDTLQHVFEATRPSASTSSPGPSGVALTGSVDPDDPMGISGSVTDKATGERVPGLVVRLRGTAAGVQCDAQGAFFLSVPELLTGKPTTLDIFEGERLLKTIPLSQRAVPCCVPVALSPEEMPSIAAPKNECQDMGTIRLHERRMLMGAMVLQEPSRSDTLERIVRPVRDALRRLRR